MEFRSRISARNVSGFSAWKRLNLIGEIRRHSGPEYCFQVS
jgi:hypothetical protein